MRPVFGGNISMITVLISKVQNSFHGLREGEGGRGIRERRNPLIIRDTGLLDKKNTETL